MSNPIASGGALTEDQRRGLSILLNMIIPPDSDKGMPGAGELDLVGYVAEFEPDRIEAIRLELDMLDREAGNQCQRTFADLNQSDRDSLVDRLRANNMQFAQNIVAQTVACYYQHDKVVVALGMEARPPFPQGNVVVPGDLSLLDPVRQRKRLYRDA